MHGSAGEEHSGHGFAGWGGYRQQPPQEGPPVCGDKARNDDSGAKLAQSLSSCYRLVNEGNRIRIADPAGDVWLDGDVIACACPDCGAPMSIRLWLRLADCWHCGASVELTEAQEEKIRHLLRLRDQQKVDQKSSQSPAQVPPITAPRKSADKVDKLSQHSGTQLGGLEPPLARARPSGRKAWSEQLPLSPARRTPLPPPATAKQVPVSHAAVVQSGYPSREGLLAKLLASIPAWLISFILHVVFLLLLGMWVIPLPQPNLVLVLSTGVGPDHTLGEPLVFEDLVTIDPVPMVGSDVMQQLELPPSPGNVDMGAEELSLNPPLMLRQVDMWSVVANGAPPTLRSGLLAGRDPVLRRQIALQSGGTLETEAAVALGLQWLAKSQNSDGSWDLNPGKEQLGANSKTAATALALLAFLGAGETHQRGQYQNVVKRGLKWLVEFQDRNGDLRGPGVGQMYAHGQAAIALCEAYAMTNDNWLRRPAQKAVDFIVKAQHREGGWRYQPGMAGDTSVVGWQLMALQSARLHYHLYVPDETLRKAAVFLDTVRGDSLGALYAYMPGRRPSPAMTAEALLCRLYLGWPTDHPAVLAGARYLLENHPPDINAPNMYYWYYATQVMHHIGGDFFRRWNYRMRPVLLQLQEKTGPNMGSWPPVGQWAGTGGRTYMTALAICTLEVYYRYMPLNKKKAVSLGSVGK